MAVRVDLDRERRQALGEADALLQRLLDFLVVERVRRAVDQPPRDTRSSRRPTTAAARRPAARALRVAAASRSARIARACARNSSAICALSRRPRAPRPRRARAPRRAPRSARGTSRPAPGSRRATSVAVSIAVRPPPTTTTGSRSCMLASESRLGRAGELQRHQEVGRRAHAGGEPVRASRAPSACPRPRRRATWSKPSANAPSASSVPPKRTPPIQRERGRAARAASRMTLRKFLSQRTVMPYSATPPKPAITRSSSGSYSVATSRIGANGTRSPSRVTPGQRAVERLDLRGRRCRRPCGRRSSGDARA